MLASLSRVVRPVCRLSAVRLPVRTVVDFAMDRQVQISSEKTPNIKSKKFIIQIQDIPQYTPDESEEVDLNKDPPPEAVYPPPVTAVILPESYGTGMHIDRNDKKEIMRSALAQKMFELDTVQSLFLGRDFLTVTKGTEEPWRYLEPEVIAKINDFFASNKPVIEEAPQMSDTAILPTDSEVVATIKELMETRVRPSVQEDGGDIFYEGFDEGTGMVRVRLAGSCVGCPSSSVTLRNGVENMLMHYIPEVKGIIDVTGSEPSARSGEESTTSADMKLQFAPDNVPQ